MLKFKHLSVLAGKEFIVSGIIKGFGDAVRKMWPEEMENCPDDMLLVLHQDHLGQEFHHAVLPEEIIDIALIKED